MSIEKVVFQAERWGLRISTAQQEVLLNYAQELADYEKANVIGTRDVDEILLDHVLDSLSCFLAAPIERADSLIDVGSGGGLPGLPIKSLRPELKTTVLEATGKKAAFLRQVTGRLGLDDIKVVNARAENAGSEPEHRNMYDVATVRAVAGLEVVLEYCVPLVREGGYVVSMKGAMDKREVMAGERAANLLGAEIQEILEVPFTHEITAKERVLVVARKLSDTPEQYPRKDGVPRKSPLGAKKGK